MRPSRISLRIDFDRDKIKEAVGILSTVFLCLYGRPHDGGRGVRGVACSCYRSIVLFLRAFSEFDGMVWTVMIAGEAGKTFTVVHPLRLTAQSSFYVGYGTDVGTDSASDTPAAVHMKESVGDKETFEEPSDRT